MASSKEKERRKVQISGKSSCMVALPKRWVREMGLEQGSEVVITRPSLSSLMITAEMVGPTVEKTEVIIDVTEKDQPDSLFRKIVSLYILGYSQITLRGLNGFFSSAKRKIIDDQVRRHLIGTEGVAESKEKITIHVLLGYSELSVDNALKKMLLIVDSMHHDALVALENNDKSLADGVMSREEEVGRFGLYVIRQLNMSLNQGIYKEAILEPRDLLGYTQVAKAMERVAYHARRIANTTLNLDNPVDKALVQRIVAAGETALGLVDEALLSLFKRDHQGADQVVEKAKRFTELEDDPVRSLADRDTRAYYSLHLLLDSERRIAEYAVEIAETVLDLTIERIVRKENSVYAKAIQ